MPNYLNNVEADVLIEWIQDKFGQSVVTPGTVHKQEFVQVAELQNSKKQKNDPTGER